jgi:hypothetical protein
MPRVIAEALGLFGAYGWDPFEMLPGVLAIFGAAEGPSVELELPGLAAPVVPVFHAGIWRPNSQGSCPAMEVLIQGLCRAAKLATSALSNEETESQIQDIETEREDFFAFEAVPDPLAQSDFEAQIRDLEPKDGCLRVVESPRGSQVRAFLQRAWSPTLIYNSCRGFERLLNKGTSRWLADCELLINSKFSSVSLCGTASLGRLLSTDNPWADQLLLVRSGRAKGTPKAIDGEFITSFCSLIGELVEQGEAECPRVIQLATDARQLFVNTPAGVLAARMGLLFSHCVSATRSELEGRYLRAALPIARELLSRSAEVRGMVRQRRDEALVQRIKTEMLRRIKRAGTIRRWKLGRSFHNYRRWPHGAALASLLASGAVCPYMEKRSTWLRYYER